jgi:sialate O-acetylesterase
MRTSRLLLTAVLVGLFFTEGAARAGDLALPSIISDHALLQAGKPIQIWGMAKPGAQVKVQFLGAAGAAQGSFAATADAQGHWAGELPACAAGTAGQLEVDADDSEKKLVNDVLVGEVWLASGQSNMTYNLSGNPYAPITPLEVSQVAANMDLAGKEAAAAQPPIRVFQVQGFGTAEPSFDTRGKWVLATPDNIMKTSAVAWFFIVDLMQGLHQPVGIIISAVGGTPVESWMPIGALEATSVGAAVEARFNKELEGYTPEKEKENDAIWDAWVKKYPTQHDQEMHRDSRPHRIVTPTSGNAPGRLYNGMIHPLQPYSMRGIIWFQADGNEGHPLEYAEMIKAMIQSWRADWKDELPFFYVEMNNMRHDPQVEPVELNNLSLIREQQQGALQLPKVDVVASLDLGVKNAHFANKQPVGQRLANMALHEVYGQPGMVNSPAFKSFKIEGNKVRVSFDNADGLRVRGGGEMKGFAIRGEKGPWVWADGAIEGSDIILSSAQVPQPTAVRYAWAMFPVISIENSAGLPLRPFRTDTDSPQ